MMTFSILMKMILEKEWRGWGCLRVRKCVWGEFMELYLSCKWIPGLRNTSGELVVNWPESCPRSAEHPHSHNFILLDFLISSWFTFSFTRMYLNFYGPFRIQITEGRDIWRKYLKYFNEEVGEHFPKVTFFFQINFLDCPPMTHFCRGYFFSLFFQMIWILLLNWPLQREHTHFAQLLHIFCVQTIVFSQFSNR